MRSRKGQPRALFDFGHGGHPQTAKNASCIPGGIPGARRQNARSRRKRASDRCGERGVRRRDVGAVPRAVHARAVRRVRISQRLRPRQRVMYGLSAAATVGGSLAYIAVSEQRRWPLEWPLILLGVAFVLHVILFAFMVYHHCVVVVRGGEVVVWKRGRPETRFAADSVQEVTAIYSDGDSWPGVHILHAAGFVVVFRGLGAFSERRQAAKVLRYAMQGRELGSDLGEEEEMMQKSDWDGKGDIDAELVV